MTNTADLSDEGYLRLLAVAERDAARDPYAAAAQEGSAMGNLGAAIGGALKGPYWTGPRALAGVSQPGEVDEWKRGMAGLWTTPSGKAGTVLGGVAAALPAAIVGGPTLAGAGLAGAGLGALMPASNARERMFNIAANFSGGVAGQWLGKQLGGATAKWAQRRADDVAAAQAGAAERQATFQAAHDARLAIPPSDARPESWIAGLLEGGLGGKIQTGQAFSVRNEPAIRDLAKRAVGMPRNMKLNPQNLAAMRDAEGQVYEQLKSSIPYVNWTPNYLQAIDRIAKPYERQAAQNPSQRVPEIDRLIEDMRRGHWSGDVAVEFAKRLRDQSRSHLNATPSNPNMSASHELGRIERKLRDAFEDLIAENLKAHGKPNLVPRYREARQKIAVIHDVEDALVEGTGQIDAQTLARKLAQGVPLVPELKVIARFRQASPRASQTGVSYTRYSPLDAFAAMTGATAGGAAGAAFGGSPTAMATGATVGILPALLRPFTRDMLASKVGQAMFRPQMPQLGVGARGAQLLTSPNTPPLAAPIGMGAAGGLSLADLWDLIQEHPPQF